MYRFVVNRKLMNVLHVIPSVSVAHGGPSRAVVEMERALADRGVNVTTVTTDDDGKGRRLSVVREEAIETEFATRWYFPLNTEFYKVSLSLARWLQKNIKKFDVVHAHEIERTRPQRGFGHVAADRRERRQLF